jgi:recombination protein RecR
MTDFSVTLKILSKKQEVETLRQRSNFMSDSGEPRPLAELIEFFSSMPGVGKRSASRMAHAILRWRKEKIVAMGELIRSLPEKITFCPECGNLSSDNALCAVCSAPGRDRSLICVVEDASHIPNIEKSGLFRGLYHVLGGKINPLDGKQASDLRIDGLLRRAAAPDAREVILALSPDVEGQATAYYIADLLKDTDVKTSIPARGLPAGSDIAFADSATLAAALSGRAPVGRQ